MWEDELTDEQEAKLLEQAAHEIQKRKLTVPAMLFLEMHKPLSFVGSQAAIVFSPFLVPFLGFDRVNNYSRLLARRDSIEKLICRLEQSETPKNEPEGHEED